jgi:hypothetical protein
MSLAKGLLGQPKEYPTSSRPAAVPHCFFVPGFPSDLTKRCAVRHVQSDGSDAVSTVFANLSRWPVSDVHAGHWSATEAQQGWHAMGIPPQHAQGPGLLPVAHHTPAHISHHHPQDLGLPGETHCHMGIGSTVRRYCHMGIGSTVRRYCHMGIGSAVCTTKALSRGPTCGDSMPMPSGLAQAASNQPEH